FQSFMHFFFFSSRRRHTRFSRDWSSDVCSSDLPEVSLSALVGVARSPFGPRVVPSVLDDLIGGFSTMATLPPEHESDDPAAARRSEERRVGKEWKAVW